VDVDRVLSVDLTKPSRTKRGPSGASSQYRGVTRHRCVCVGWVGWVGWVWGCGGVGVEYWRVMGSPRAAC